MPENESGSKEAEADYSLNSCESFAWFDRDSWSWKTSQRCLDGDLETYSESFPRAGTMRNGIVFRRQPSAPLTGGTGCLSSGHNVPTPTKSDAQRMPNTGRNSHGPTIHEIAEQSIPIRMWPSPDARDSHPEGFESGKRRLEKWGTVGLQTAVKMWPTPKAQDCRAAKYDRGKSNLGEEVYASEPEATAASGSLNPQWVEWLMGFPPEWTALSASETPSSRKSRKSSGGASSA